MPHTTYHIPYTTYHIHRLYSHQVPSLYICLSCVYLVFEARNARCFYRYLILWCLDSLMSVLFFLNFFVNKLRFIWKDSLLSSNICLCFSYRYWISAFIFPQAFLSTALQRFSRTTKVTLDHVEFTFNVINDRKISQFDEPAETGVIICGTLTLSHIFFVLANVLYVLSKVL